MESHNIFIATPKNNNEKKVILDESVQRMNSVEMVLTQTQISDRKNTDLKTEGTDFSEIGNKKRTQKAVDWGQVKNNKVAFQEFQMDIDFQRQRFQNNDKQ